MANIKVVDMSGKEVESIELSDKIYGVEKINEAVLHAAVRAYLLNQRQGTQSALTRSEVSGGGKKPWRQKGTGRARQGSTRSPQWTHGGVVFAPKPREYRVTLTRKTKRAALYSALSSKLANNQIIVVDKIAMAEYKTKDMVKMLADIKAEKKALVVLDTVDEKVIKSLANIPGVKTTQANQLNVYDILNCGSYIMTKAAASIVEEVYGK